MQDLEKNVWWESGQVLGGGRGRGGWLGVVVWGRAEYGAHDDFVVEDHWDGWVFCSKSSW